MDRRQGPPHDAPQATAILRPSVRTNPPCQDPSGGFHVLLNDPATPLETTGSTMFAMHLHEAMRKGWLPPSFHGTVEHAWNYVKGNIRDDGSVDHVYTGWALPAERRLMPMSRVETGWVPGLILLAANELTVGGE